MRGAKRSKEFFLFLLLLVGCAKEEPKNIRPFADAKIQDPKKCYLEAPKEENSQQLFVDDVIPKKQHQAFRTYSTPTKATIDTPYFVDDIDFDWFEISLNRQIKRFEGKNLNGTIRMGNKTYPLERAKESLLAMKDLVVEAKRCLALSTKNYCYEAFHNEVVLKFDIYQPDLKKSDPRFGEKKNTLFTGYYTPLITSESKKSDGFKYAIYKKPNSREFDKYTREQIDFEGVLEGKNLELAYGPDMFQLYLLHVEGGGRILVNDSKNKEKFYISYDGTNKKSWNFIANYMYEKGYIKSKSIKAQKDYLQANPHKAREIYSSCPSYVYFKKTKTPPLGSDNVPLTDRRSIATDSGLYKFKGLIAFVKTKRAKEVWEKLGDDCGNLEFREFSRFFIDQDTGGAIKGKGRVDIYFGEGEYAKAAASQMKFTGELYFLMLKSGYENKKLYTRND